VTPPLLVIELIILGENYTIPLEHGEELQELIQI
jgi:hypothetical protein